MHQKKSTPCGSWKSAITAEYIIRSSTSFQEILVDDDTVYWIESRPTEAGRAVIVRANPDGCIADVTPQGFNARTLVNSYGGGAFAVSQKTVIFSNLAGPTGEMPYARYSDQRLFCLEPGQEPVPLTDTLGSRYAAGVIDVARNNLITVREDRTYSVHGEVMSAIVSVNLDGKGLQKLLVQGNDFYTSPRLSPDGRQLCWLTWNYPDMPWDSSELWLADLDKGGSLSNARLIAGGGEESIFQPEWSPDGVLYFISDRTNWWNLYRFCGERVEPVCPKAADFGAPQWIMRMSQYDFVSCERIICSYVEDGEWQLAILEIPNGTLRPVETGFTAISHVRAGQDFVVFFGSSPTSPVSLVKLNLETNEQIILRSSINADTRDLLPYISRPQSISFATTGNATAYAFYYPPENPDFAVPTGEKPPLIIMCHGGPTDASTTGLSFLIPYFTSRGFAVVNVNYRGSSGYGRAYRQALYSNWGVYDWEDCASAAYYLIERGDVDAQRIVGRGGSSGGYTTLCLLTFTNLLRAGASYFGISNLNLIAVHTGKLEAHYSDKLIAPYPQGEAIYEARSPYFHADQIKSPAVFFQGLEDSVVPSEQTKTMVASLEQRGIPVASFYFPGERHGFCIASNIQQALEAELAFYACVLGFAPADDLPSIEIKNWL
jgi:dipeptidyl aminopeptidase/acylaminoacyl peptidase